MHTVCFACLFFPKQLPWVVQWALDAEVRQGAQTNGLHCTRAGPGEVGEEAKANSGSRQSKDRHLGGAGSGLVIKQWRTSLLEHLALTTCQKWEVGRPVLQAVMLTLSLQWFLEQRRWVSHRQCTEGLRPPSPVQSLQASKTWFHLNIHTPRNREINTEWEGEHLHFYIL